MVWHLFLLRLTKEGYDPTSDCWYGIGAKVFVARSGSRSEILIAPDELWTQPSHVARNWAKQHIRATLDEGAKFYR